MTSVTDLSGQLTDSAKQLAVGRAGLQCITEHYRGHYGRG